MEKQIQPSATAPSDFDHRPKVSLPWGKLMVVTMVISFVVSSVSGYFFGGWLQSWIGRVGRVRIFLVSPRLSK